MSTSYLTPREIIDVHNKWPDTCMLKMNYDKLRSNEAKEGKNGATYWIQYLIRRSTDTWTQVYIKAKSIILCSSVKVPQKKTIDDTNKLSIIFNKLTKEHMEKTDYSVDVYDKLLESHNEFCDAMYIFHKHLMMLYETVQADSDKPKAPFKIHKNDKASFCQEYRIATDADRINNNITCVKIGTAWKVKLDIPIFRISLPVDMLTRKIGKKWDDKPISPIVFDARKSKKSNNFANYPATIISKGKIQELTASNSKHFITYMSLGSFKIHFAGVCSSPQGLSSSPEFHKLSLWPHKPMIQKDFDEDDYTEMSAFGASGYDENIDIDAIDEPDEKVNASKKIPTRNKLIKMSEDEMKLDDTCVLEPDENEANENETNTESNNNTNNINVNKSSTPIEINDDSEDDEIEKKTIPKKTNKRTSKLNAGTRRVNT